MEMEIEENGRLLGSKKSRESKSIIEIPVKDI